jgi:predicted nucleic acid-binding protein
VTPDGPEVVVLDTSVTAAFCFADEATEATDALLQAVAATGAVVPCLWPFEIANVLVHAERRHRISAADVSRVLEILAGLPIEIEAPTALPRGALDLARAHRLTVYDAAYLEVAMRRGLPLATLDEDLRKAARAAGVRLSLA